MVDTHLSPFDHVVLDNLLCAFHVQSTVNERLVPVRVIIRQYQLARFLPVITVQVVRTAVTARAPDSRVAKGGRVTQAPHTVYIQVGHVPACKNNNSDDSDINPKIINSVD